MKSYFINIDFHTRNFNKFCWTIVQENLKETALIDVAKGVIRKMLEDLEVSVDDVTINVTAFNEIEF